MKKTGGNTSVTGDTTEGESFTTVGKRFTMVCGLPPQAECGGVCPGKFQICFDGFLWSF